MSQRRNASTVTAKTAAIWELSNKPDDAFSKILTTEMTTATTSKRTDKLSSTVQQLVTDVERHKGLLDQPEKRKPSLKDRSWRMQTNGWRCALKLLGLKEEANEDVTKTVINTLGKRCQSCMNTWRKFLILPTDLF